MLDQLQARLTGGQRQDLLNEFQRAKGFILKVSRINAPPPVFRDYTSKQNRKNHVDIEVHVGVAF